VTVLKIQDELICIVRSNEFAPDPRTERLARFLAKSGARVTLLGLNRSSSSMNRELVQGVEIERLGFGRKSKLPAGDLTLSPFVLIWMVWSITRLLRHRPATVIASDFDALLPSLFYFLLRKPRLIYNPHDFYADNLRHPTPNLLTVIVRTLERRYVGRADALILPDVSRLRQYPDSRLPSHFVEIVNSPNDLFVDKIPDASKKLTVDGISVFYAGQLDKTRGLMQLMNVVKREDGIHLILAGHGVHEDQLIQLARTCRNITFVGKIGHSDVMSLTQQCDVVFAMYDPRIPNNVYASPNKLFEAMACGKPILVNDGTRLAELVRTHECGIVLEYGNEEVLSAALRKLRDNRILRDGLGDNGKKAFESNYVWRIMEDRLRAFFDSI